MISYKRIFAVSYFLFSALATGAELELLPVPSVVTGSFSPFRLEIDGKPLITESLDVKEIHLNGIAAKKLKKKGSPFFNRVTGDRLKIEVVTLPDNQKVDWEFALPTATLEGVGGGKVRIQLSGEIETVSIDKKKVPVVENRIEWDVPTSSKSVWHVLEIRHPLSKAARIFNLKVTPSVAKTEATFSRAPSSLGEASSDWELTRFSASPMLAYQSSNAYSGSFYLGWTPQYRLSTSFGVLGALGGVFFHSAATGRRIGVVDVAVGPAWLSQAWDAYAQLGAQTWVTYGGTFPMARAGWQAHLSWGLGFAKVDRLFLDYTFCATRPKRTHFARLGVGVLF